MPLKSIEIICIPCPKCERVKKLLNEAVQNIERQNKTKLSFDFKHTTSLGAIGNFGLNPSQTPAIIINGNAELAGLVEPLVLKKKLESMIKF